MEKHGEQFLYKKDSRFHTTQPVEHEMKRKKRAGEKISQKPADKISDWLKVIEKTHTGHRDDPRVLERIKEYYHKEHVIKSKDIPKSYFDNQRKLAREQGHGDIEITDEMKSQLSEVIVSDQESTLDNWVEYFISLDSDGYPMWAKYWAFTGMLKLATFDKEKHAFAKRDKGTVAPFPDLDREVLAYVVDAIVKKANKENILVTEDNLELKQLLDGANFGKLYAYAIEKVTPAEENELLNTKGEWIKYPQGSDHMPLVQSLQGHGTGWCTAGEYTAKAQLQGDDFHIYYSHDKDSKPTIPRVAIRMNGQEIGEVRGIAPNQNMDQYIGEIADKKLAEFPDGEKYKKKSADMEQLTEIDKKNVKGEELNTDELRFLHQLDSKIEGFGYQVDPRIEEILSDRDAKSDISLITGYSKEQISVTKDEALSGGIKFHYGDLYLNSLQSAEGLKLPETMNGDLYLHSLQSAEGLNLPKTVDGYLDLYSLQSAEGLNLPETVGGNLNLSRLQSTEGLNLPKTVGGDLCLNSLQSAEGLNLPETVDGYLDLSSLQSAEGLNLPEIVDGNLYLSRLQSAEGLNLPKTVGGNLCLNSIQSAEGLNLPETVGGYLNLGGLQSAEGLNLPETVGGYLNLGGLQSAEGLELPKTIGGVLNLEGLKLAEGLELPKTVNGDIGLGSLQSVEKEKLKKLYPKLKII